MFDIWNLSQLSVFFLGKTGIKLRQLEPLTMISGLSARCCEVTNSSYRNYVAVLGVRLNESFNGRHDVISEALDAC